MSLLHVASYKGSNRIIVYTGYELAGIRSVKLLRYTIKGYPQNPAGLCIYMKIEDLETQAIWAGIEYPNLPLAPAPNTNNKYLYPINQSTTMTGYWPLYLDMNSTTVHRELSSPVEMCGGNGWGANRRISIEFYDSDLKPATFESIALDFKVSKVRQDEYPEYRRYNTANITPDTNLYQAIMDSA